ncbi:MAG: UbiH/UbiF family hydroxylase [Pseudomonadota bacterium]|nr:UbiH/UbiF family hydroxylase [Pseudomonadota bacterium]
MESDIVIVGGGLNGAALACALRHGPHSVVLVEPHPPVLATSPEGSEQWDPRVYAYSPGNVNWIKSLGGWGEPVRAQAVYRMRIHGDAGGLLDFDALDAGLPELAWIAENGRLQSALWRAMNDTPNLRVVTTPAEAITWGGDGRHTLRLADGSTLSTRLLVAADGANSWVRQQAGIGFVLEDYHHIGVVANFETEKPHRGAAWQWFRADGVLAYLPLPGNRISMVWSTPPEHADELRALAPDELARRVAEAGINGPHAHIRSLPPEGAPSPTWGGPASGRYALGELRCITPAAGFPLKRRLADEWVRPGLVLLGDTAHTVHPLAGQGVNLGFRDSRLLAEVLRSGGDPGEIGRLTAYAARRREDVVSMQFTTGGLRKLFGREESLIRTLRNQGMNFTDHFPPLSQALMHHAVL